MLVDVEKASWIARRFLDHVDRLKQLSELPANAPIKEIIQDKMADYWNMAETISRKTIEIPNSYDELARAISATVPAPELTTIQG